MCSDPEARPVTARQFGYEAEGKLKELESGCEALKKLALPNIKASELNPETAEELFRVVGRLTGEGAPNSVSMRQGLSSAGHVALEGEDLKKAEAAKAFCARPDAPASLEKDLVDTAYAVRKASRL